MRKNLNYNYIEEIEDNSLSIERKIKIPFRKPKKKKINFIAVGLLFCILFFICLPVCKNVYNYLFLNSIRNRNLHFNAQEIYNNSQKPFFNSELLGRQFLAPVNFKSPNMTQLNLNYEMKNLKQRINSLLDNYPKLTAGVFIYDIQTGNYVSINGEKQFPAASIIKVPILLQLFRTIETDSNDLHSIIEMTPYFRAEGSGYLQYKPDKSKFEIEELAQLMIRMSDNSATNMILAEIGGMHELNASLRNWGFNKTYMQNWLPDIYGTNLTTPKDMATILYNADNADFLSLENRAKIVEIMSKVKNRSLLCQGLPDGVGIYHKTGDIGEMLGDAGVVSMPNGERYIIVTMVKRNWNDYSARQLINSISSVTYNAFASKDF